MEQDNIKSILPEWSPENETFIKNQVDQLNKDHNIDLSDYSYIFKDMYETKKQTDAKQEIFISITANILEHEENSPLPQSKAICNNNYYIPVPSGNNHENYLKLFFDYIENCMGLAASNAQSKENNNG